MAPAIRSNLVIIHATSTERNKLLGEATDLVRALDAALAKAGV